MKLTYDQTKDRRQLDRLVHMLLSSRRGEAMSGMVARRLFADLYGLDIDHHEYACMLDAMERRQECTRDGWNRNGDSQYIIS